MKQFPKFITENTARADNVPRPWFSVSNAGAGTEITIYDKIGKSPWDGSGIADKEFAAALNAIPLGTKINLRINSGGGSVKDGLAIHNRIAARSADVTCYVDGMAVSTASWIACAASKVIIPENGLMMIHDPQAMIMDSMTAPELREAADWLDKNKTVIVSMYRSKTGRSDQEISEAMSKETWFTGKEAKDWGLADEVSKTRVSLQNNFDLSRYRRVPAAIQNNSAPENGGDKNKNTLMRDKIIALLNAHKIAFDNSATDEQLAELLNKIQPQSTPPPAPAATPAPAAQPTNVISVDDLLKKVATLENKYEVERKARVEAAVDAAINESKIPANSREVWLKRAMADETILNDLAALNSRPPGTDPVASNVEVIGDSAADIAKALNACDTAKNSWMRGNDIHKEKKGREAISNGARNKAILINKHYEKLAQNANTLSSDLQRSVILFGSGMRAFKEQLVALGVFSTIHQSIPLEGRSTLAKVIVPYIPLETAASTAWNGDNGYVMGDTVLQDKEVTIDQRYYQPIRFSSDELNRVPALGSSMRGIIEIKAEKLASDTFTAVAGAITLANFGAAALVTPATSFDLDSVTDLGGVATDAEWPKSARGLVVVTAYDTNLRKDPGVKSALAFGGTEGVRGGSLDGLQVGGFRYYSNANIPTNSQNLKGWICFPSALMVATSPIMPDDSIRQAGCAYEIVVDPQTGLAFEYRRWGNPDFDQRREIIECNYGYAVGEAAALERITSS